jgi:indole-3-glycerol phosphate synthase
MSGVLQRILTYKREEVAVRKRETSLAEFERHLRTQPPAQGFSAALERAAPRPALIAEIKRASPSKGVIREDFDAPELAVAYAKGGATCLSVLTDAPSFQGEENDLIWSRAAVPGVPILRKDFMIDPWQIAESRVIGADAILVIMAAVDDALARDLLHEAKRFGMDALVETHDEAELDRALQLDARLIGINNRSLSTFVTDLAITERLAARVPKDRLVVSESGIGAPVDIVRLQRAGARAFLVGESLMLQPDVEGATRALLGC